MGSILVIPAVLFLFIPPDLGVWSHRLEIGAYIFIFSLGGLGGVLAILLRAGVVQFTYSDSDKRTLTYRMSKHIAEIEQSHEREFSDDYYEDLGVTPPKEKGPDDKPGV